MGPPASAIWARIRRRAAWLYFAALAGRRLENHGLVLLEPMIRILLIEDLAVVRESLAMALATAADMELRCCSSIEEGIDLLKGSAGLFDVVLLKPSAGGRKADELLSIAN